MSEIKWIKITTNMFEDEKIDFIESLPESDAILIIWVKLLTLAGKTNAKGYIFLTENIPYTEEMLAHKFRRSLNVVKLALDTFRRLGMVESDDKGIYISNWEKHQNIEGMEKVRELTRQRVQKHREQQKRLESCNVTSNVSVTQSNAIDIDKELDIDKENNKIPFADIITYLNLKTNKNYKYSTSKTKDLIKARFNEGFTLEDFKKVIDNKVLTWANSEMDKYLRPETLFGTKFESYLNESKPKSNIVPNRPELRDIREVLAEG